MKADLTRTPSVRANTSRACSSSRAASSWMPTGTSRPPSCCTTCSTLAADIIGPAGGPEDNCGFVVSLADGLEAGAERLPHRTGRYYVDGLLCELDADPIAVAPAPRPQPKQIVVSAWTVDGVEFASDQYVELTDASTPPQTKVAQVVDVDRADEHAHARHRHQRHDPLPHGCAASWPPIPPAAATRRAAPLAIGDHFAYLDVWERAVTYAEDDAIREVAFNGADTAARTKIVCQVKVMPADARRDGSDDADRSAESGVPAGAIGEERASTDPCTVSPNARYQRPGEPTVSCGNPHWQPGRRRQPATPTFKWSRENGSVVFPIARDARARAPSCWRPGPR